MKPSVIWEAFCKIQIHTYHSELDVNENNTATHMMANFKINYVELLPTKLSNTPSHFYPLILSFLCPIKGIHSEQL